MLNAALVGALGAIWFFVMYKVYGGFLDKKIIEPNDDHPTPAHSLRDDVDFVPSQPSVDARVIGCFSPSAFMAQRSSASSRSTSHDHLMSM